MAEWDGSQLKGARLSAARSGPEAWDRLSRMSSGRLLERYRPALKARWDVAFIPFFVACAVGAVAWLMAGLVPAVAHSIPSLHERLHDIGRGRSLVAEVAANAARSSHSSYSWPEVVGDYLFSALNITLAIFLIRRCPTHRAARLLAFGFLGTSVAFNLQGHFARQVAPFWSLGLVELWHNHVHVVSGVCYVLGLLVFPDGHLQSRRRVPGLLVLTLLFALLSLITVDDHTLGLVLVFGIFTPVAGVASQIERYRRAPTAEQRQQSRVLLGALAISLGGACLILGAAAVLSGSDPALSHTTKDYELSTPSPGLYFFRCDPHPMDMRGYLVVKGSYPVKSAYDISARNIDFNKALLRLPPGRDITLRFTNFDGELHNVAIYRDATAQKPIFIGEAFTGGNITERVFRTFRVLFVALPIALFVGIVRFHLWDVNRLVARTLVYAAVTGLLALTYYGLVVGVETVLPATETSNGVVVAATTLLVAGLFTPVRRHIQAFIDRRFYRRRYDAAKTIQDFSTRLRQEIDLDSLTRELLQVVRDTMQPTQISLWLGREADDSHGDSSHV
jgi:plastocyanin